MIPMRYVIREENYNIILRRFGSKRLLGSLENMICSMKKLMQFPMTLPKQGNMQRYTLQREMQTALSTDISVVVALDNRFDANGTQSEMTPSRLWLPDHISRRAYLTEELPRGTIAKI